MVMAAHANQMPEPVLKRRPEAPAWLAQVVMKCLAKAPAARPQNAAEIVLALREAQAGGAAKSREPILQRLPAWLPWWIAAAATAAAVYFGVRR